MNKFKITSAFQYVFFTAVSLTLLSGGYSVYLASQGNLTPEQNRVFETCNTTWNMGIGAIFGLLGSKATDLLEDNEDKEE
jgi:hypothetical protein